MQSFEDPFGETPFKAIPSAEDFQAPPQASTSSDYFHNSEPSHASDVKADTGTGFDFGDPLSGLTYSTSNMSTVSSPSMNFQFSPQELPANQNTDVLADILPPSGPSHSYASHSQQAFSAPEGQPTQPGANAFGSYQPQPGAMVPVSSNMITQTQNGYGSGSYLSNGGSTAPITSHMGSQMPTGPTAQFNGGSFISQQGGYAPANNGNFYAQQGTSTVPITQHMAPQPPMGSASHFNSGNFLPQQSPPASVAPQVGSQALTGPAPQPNNDTLGNIFPQTGASTSLSSQQSLPDSTGALAIIQTQPSKNKFEPKSAVWADTLSRGLVNLNISGRECIQLLFLYSPHTDSLIYSLSFFPLSGHYIELPCVINQTFFFSLCSKDKSTGRYRN